jgi:hypothetical protein
MEHMFPAKVDRIARLTDRHETQRKFLLTQGNQRVVLESLFFLVCFADLGDLPEDDEKVPEGVISLHRMPLHLFAHHANINTLDFIYLSRFLPARKPRRGKKAAVRPAERVQ